jgi:hypothetical protein
MLHQYIGKYPLSVPNAGFIVTNIRWADMRMIQPGDVVDGRPGSGLAGINNNNWNDHWKELSDPRDRPTPRTPTDLKTECDFLDDWMRAESLPWSVSDARSLNGSVFPFIGANRVAKARLEQLIDAAVNLGMTDPPDTGCLDPRTARVALNKLRQLAETLSHDKSDRRAWKKFPFKEESVSFGTFDAAAARHFPASIPIPIHYATVEEIKIVERLGLESHVSIAAAGASRGDFPCRENQFPRNFHRRPTGALRPPVRVRY